ncbi:MAG TPA: hypothetical protein VGK73_15115 [Polyangiaceae bacterium]
MKVTLVGLTPLIVNNFDEKTRQQMADNQAGVARNRRSPKVAKECYERARLRDGKGKDCVRALWIKCACVDAARFAEGVKMTHLRGALRVQGDMLPLRFKKMRMRCDPVRNANGGADLRYRPEYEGWSVDLLVSYRENMITPDSVLNLLNNAGQSIGLCERRPGQNGDTFGMFEVQISKTRRRAA